jgi:hypothetical protein
MQRFAAPPMPGMMPHPMYRPILPPPSSAPQSDKVAGLQLQFDAHPVCIYAGLMAASIHLESTTSTVVVYVVFC